jgi:hypothetical protein
MTALMEVVEQLPPELQQEVEDFARFLLETKVGAARRELRPRRLHLSWAGDLAAYRDKFTSLELQKKSLDWWTPDVSG